MVAAAVRGNWRWWYAAIADWMLAHPGGTQLEMARDLNKGVGTISAIMTSDIFKAYYAQRRRDFEGAQNEALRSKLYRLADKTLDAAISKLDKQQDQVKFEVLSDMMGSTLEALGFGTPSVQVTQNNIDASSKTVNLPSAVTPAALEEARMALRNAERKLTVQAESPLPVPGSTRLGVAGGTEGGADVGTVLEGELFPPVGRVEGSQ